MQLPGLSVGIVADDLTGACDTALQFFSMHAKTHILLESGLSGNRDSQDTDNGAEPGDRASHHVWSINTATRHSASHEAQSVVRQAIAMYRTRYGVDNFYKKIDSTLRGNIAQECLGMLDELKAQCAVIVPAYPHEGRRTVGGYQLVRGVPVEKTVVARDPLFPVRQSHVPTLLEQASRPEIVGYIPLSIVLHGAGPILVRLKELISEGKKLVVIDATSDEDLEQIALAIEKAQKYAKVLPCGSAGLAQALADLWSPDPEEGSLCPIVSPPLHIQPSPILIVSGSSTDTTRQQLMRLIENYAYYGEGSKLETFELTPQQILGLAPIEKTIQSIVQALAERNTVILSISLREEAYAQTMALALEHEISEAQASRMAQEAIARVASGVLMQKPVKLILTGGETTCEVCKSIDSRSLEIVAEAEPSIPLCKDNRGRWIVTKSGGFGTPMALANVVKFIKQRESSSVHA